jgi:hypothetical protein
LRQIFRASVDERVTIENQVVIPKDAQAELKFVLTVSRFGFFGIAILATNHFGRPTQRNPYENAGLVFTSGRGQAISVDRHCESILAATLAESGASAFSFPTITSSLLWLRIQLCDCLPIRSARFICIAQRCEIRLMPPLLGLLSIICGLWFLLGMPIVVSNFAWKCHRNRTINTGLVIALAMLFVFYISAGMIWTLDSSPWNLSFMQTLEASVNTEKYGHAAEHRAETMVAWLLMVSTFTALLGGAIATVIQSAISRRKSRT